MFMLHFSCQDSNFTGQIMKKSKGDQSWEIKSRNKLESRLGCWNVSHNRQSSISELKLE